MKVSRQSMKVRKRTKTRRNAPPMAIRQLRAEMELRHLSLADAAAKARVNYHVASAILNGRTVHPTHEASLRTAILSTRIPA